MITPFSAEIKSLHIFKKSKIKNRKSKIKNQKSKTKNQKSKIQKKFPYMEASSYGNSVTALFLKW